MKMSLDVLPILLASLLALTILVQTVHLYRPNGRVPATAMPQAQSLGWPSGGTFRPLQTVTPLQDFVQSVVNGKSDQVVGIYVPGLLALPVGQQPKGNTGFVTREPDSVTQFNLARKYGTIGILAHNDLAGAKFGNLKLHQYAIAVYGDGRLDYFIIDEIQQYQALSPTSTYSDFRNINEEENLLSAGQVFSRVYFPGNRLVFQTCIAAQGDPSWGRLFIIARPATRQVISVLRQTSLVLDTASLGLVSH